MPTLKDIAKKTGFSVAAVSYALNGNTAQVAPETSRIILEAARDLNYVPNRIAKSLRTSKTFSLGVVAEDITVFCSPEMIDGIGEYAEGKGYQLILNNLRLYARLGQRYIRGSVIEQYKEQVRHIVYDTMDREVDAYIYVGGHYRDVHDIFPEVEKPLVYTYCFCGDRESNWVIYDDEELGYMMTQHLLVHGHRRIGVVTGIAGSIPSAKRMEGYERAMREAGLALTPAYICEGDWEGKAGYQGGCHLLGLKTPPTAIFAFNDAMAQGVMQAAAIRGVSIPGELSLVGCDNMHFCDYLYPRLTSAQLPLREMGAEAARFAIDLLEGGVGPGQHAKLSCTLVPRDSVAKAQ